MTLYVGVFDGDTEIEGTVIGHYSDYGALLDKIKETLDPSIIQNLKSSTDCNEVWDKPMCEDMMFELMKIRERFVVLNPVHHIGVFEHNECHWRNAKNLNECYLTVDGEPIIDVLLRYCSMVNGNGREVVFQ